jgi:hypothetical protein
MQDELKCPDCHARTGFEIDPPLSARTIRIALALGGLGGGRPQ